MPVATQNNATRSPALSFAAITASVGLSSAIRPMTQILRLLDLILDEREADRGARAAWRDCVLARPGMHLRIKSHAP
jgi:hypothetical protein